MAPNQPEENVEPEEISVSFDLIQGIASILLKLERIEQRQRNHSTLLFKLMEKIAPEGFNEEQYYINTAANWLGESLLNIKDDVDAAKAIFEKK